MGVKAVTVNRETGIWIDLNQFKLSIRIPGRIELSLHFDSPSRRFYLSVIALVVTEMKRQGKVTSILLDEHQHVLALLNETVGGEAGSSEMGRLIPRIYRKWKDALPDLEHSPLLRVMAHKKGYEDGAGKAYGFSDKVKDLWANLFEYKGSLENVRLRFSLDRLGLGLDDVVITHGESPTLKNLVAWDNFIESCKPPAGDNPPPSMKFASVDRTTYPVPENPSIAVLPFKNLTGEQGQEFLADGITESIIGAISRVSGLFVIASNSVFTYKGKAVKVQTVGEEMGVQYVLEGSVQKEGDRVRITVQLIDALKGHHLWADRYDRELKDLFAIQDDITKQIITALDVKLTCGEVARIDSRGTDNLQAYLKFLEARRYVAHQSSREKVDRARQLMEEVIAMDPGFRAAYHVLGVAHMMTALYGFSRNPRESLELSNNVLEKAIEVDGSSASVVALRGFVLAMLRRFEEAIAEVERAYELAPNDQAVLHWYGAVLSYVGRAEESIPLLEKVLRPSIRDGKMLTFGPLVWPAERRGDTRKPFHMAGEWLIVSQMMRARKLD